MAPAEKQIFQATAHTARRGTAVHRFTEIYSLLQAIAGEVGVLTGMVLLWAVTLGRRAAGAGPLAAWARAAASLACCSLTACAAAASAFAAAGDGPLTSGSVRFLCSLRGNVTFGTSAGPVALSAFAFRWLLMLRGTGSLYLGLPLSGFRFTASASAAADFGPLTGG